MKFKEMVAQMFGAAKEAGVSFDDLPADADAATALADPRVADLQAQIAASQAQIGAMQAQARERAASAFVASLVAAHKALPAEAATFAALHTQAAQDDARDGGTRTATLETALNARPAHTLTQEQVGSQALIALTQQATTEDKDARKRRLMGMTALGRAALKEAR
jgi:hypothetical protein